MRVKVAARIRPTWFSFPGFFHSLLWILWYWIKMGDSRLRPRSYDSWLLVWVFKFFWSLAVLICVVFCSLGRILGHYFQLRHDSFLLQHFLFIFVPIPSSDAIEEPNWKMETKYPGAKSYQNRFLPRPFQSIICSHTAIRSYFHTTQLLKRPKTVLMVHFSEILWG
jgi:hypothetical protein